MNTNRRRAILCLLYVTLTFLLAACGSTPASNPSPTPATEVRPTRTPRPAATETVATTVATTAATTVVPTPTSSAAERLPVTSAEAGLMTLGNVQIEMKLNGVIKTEGQTDEPINITFLETRLQNGDRSLTIASESPDTGLTQIIYLQLGGQMYQYVESRQDRQCLSTSGSDIFNGSLLTPDSLIGNLSNAKLIEREVRINGFTTDRYSFNLEEQELGYRGQARGELWVATNPTVVVRHIGELNGTLTDTALDEGGVLIPGSVGNLRWEYNVTRLAANTTITLPNECAQQQAASADIPLPPNISNQVRMGELISFETTTSAADIVSFYRTEMVNQGWRADETTQYGDTYQLTFSKDGRVANVNISTQNNKTMVIILLSSS